MLNINELKSLEKKYNIWNYWIKIYFFLLNLKFRLYIKIIQNKKINKN